MTGRATWNLKAAYEEKETWIASLLGATLIAVTQALFTDVATLAGNKGAGFAVAEIVTGVLLALLFGLNLGLLWYKLRLASTMKAHQGGATLLGGVLGVLVTGCPACSITLASYLGLAGALSALPFSGLEVKVAGLALLIYSTRSLALGLTSCVPAQRRPHAANAGK